MDYDLQKRRAYPGVEGNIESLQVRMVAVRGTVGDWTVYFATKEMLPERLQMLWNVYDDDPGYREVIDNWIAANGNKIPEDAARWNFFRNISGPYRD